MSYTKKALAAASAILMGTLPTATLAHTNSIGYVGDGQGGITFWYGSWHGGTNFNEAEIKLEGANGTSYTTTINQFNLLQNSTPAGLIPGTNYFTSDGTQLVPYGDPNGGGDSYTWQGLNFTGLAAGDYTFTYIPLGDPQSYQPNGTPTMDWVPMDQVIRSATVTLSATLLSGDANQNGILDIYEFGTVQQPSTPTLVSSVTNPYSQNIVTTITETPSETDGVQTMTRDVDLDVTTTYATVDTYSDNSTTTSYSSTNSQSRYSSKKYFGRIDQLEALDAISGTSNGLLDHEPITNHKKKFRIFENNTLVKSYNADAYDGFTTILGGGFEYDLTKGWTAGVHYNDLSTEMKGVDSISHLKRQHLGIFNSFHGRDLALVTNAGGSNDTYDYERTIESQYTNWGETKGQQWWVHNRLYLNNSGSIKPFIGHTVQNVRRDAYTETGSVQSARKVEEVNQTSHVGEAGLLLETRFGGKKKDVIGVSLEGSYGTDNSYGVSAAIDYKESIYIEAAHNVADGMSNNSVAAKVKFRF